MTAVHLASTSPSLKGSDSSVFTLPGIPGLGLPLWLRYHYIVRLVSVGLKSCGDLRLTKSPPGLDRNGITLSSSESLFLDPLARCYRPTLLYRDWGMSCLGSSRVEDPEVHRRLRRSKIAVIPLIECAGRFSERIAEVRSYLRCHSVSDDIFYSTPQYQVPPPAYTRQMAEGEFSLGVISSQPRPS